MPAINSSAGDFPTLDNTPEGVSQFHIFFGPILPNQTLRRCDLYNASYSLQVTFQNSQQDLRVKKRALLHGVSTSRTPFASDGQADYIPYGSQLFYS